MTFEEMMETALSAFAGKYDTQEGSFLYTVLAPAIYAIWEFYDRLSDVDEMVHPNEESGSYIDADAMQYGITRKPAVKATVTLKFQGEEGAVIPKGSIFYDNLGNEFSTDSEATISGGTATARATAVEAGNAANVPQNTVVNLGTYIAGIKSVTNEAPAAGGAEEESDAALFERLSAFKKRPATSGNAYSYEQWALSVAGVGAAKVYPLENGAGTVGIVIADEDKQPVSQEIVEAAQSYIDEQKPIGVTSAAVRSVEKFHIDVTANVNIAGSQLLAQAEDDFRQALMEYFKQIAMAEGEIKINAVGALLMDVEGVLDYDSLKLNGSAANVAIAVGKVPSVSEVTLHAVN